MNSLNTGSRPVTLLQAATAGIVIVAVLLGGVLIAWLSREAEQSLLDVLIAARLFGL